MIASSPHEIVVALVGCPHSLSVQIKADGKSPVKNCASLDVFGACALQVVLSCDASTYLLGKEYRHLYDLRDCCISFKTFT